MKTEIENLRELDCWIGINVFGKKAISNKGPRPTEGTEDDYFVVEYVDFSRSLPRYTKGERFQELLEKCAEKISTASIEIYQGADEGPEYRRAWCVTGEGMKNVAMADTLPIAICLFAKALYSK